MVVLHEGEEGVRGAFVECDARRRECPTDAVAHAVDLDPNESARFAWSGRRRISFIRISSMPTFCASPQAPLARVPIRTSARSTASTSSAVHPARSPPSDRASARFAHAQIAISHGLADYLAATRGI